MRKFNEINIEENFFVLTAIKFRCEFPYIIFNLITYYIISDRKNHDFFEKDQCRRGPNQPGRVTGSARHKLSNNKGTPRQ